MNVQNHQCNIYNKICTILVIVLTINLDSFSVKKFFYVNCYITKELCPLSNRKNTARLHFYLAINKSCILPNKILIWCIKDKLWTDRIIQTMKREINKKKGENSSFYSGLITSLNSRTNNISTVGCVYIQ